MVHRAYTARDRAQLAARGISLEVARWQLEALRSPEHHPLLDRPCTWGDGIRQLDTDQLPGLIAAHEGAAAEGRWTKFVPASGAASRMFPLHDHESRARLAANLPRFAFYEDLQRCLAAEGRDLDRLLKAEDFRAIAECLLHRPGLGYADSAKALLPFHRYGRRTRTAFEEHLRQAAACFRQAGGRCRAHFTVLPAHQPQFEDLLTEVRPQIEAELGVCLEVTFSVQDSATQTLALDNHGELVRTAEGELVLRPGGHGALLENLQRLQTDLVLVENIDNVCHQRLQDPTLCWTRILGGYLVRLQEQIHLHQRALEQGPTPAACEQVERFIAAQLPGTAAGRDVSASLSQRVRQLQLVLDRPLRVCGMVVNHGDPGGGPFWVAEPDGRQTLQIVESSELDRRSQSQLDIFGAATHFNPVFMGLALRDHRGRPYQLDQFVDRQRFISTHKFQNGRSVRVLEWPGLWNGSMHHWNTVFIEVPAEVFAPVKDVFDLLHREHQEFDAGAPQRTH